MSLRENVYSQLKALVLGGSELSPLGTPNNIKDNLNQLSLRYYDSQMSQTKYVGPETWKLPSKRPTSVWHDDQTTDGKIAPHFHSAHKDQVRAK